MSHEMRLNPNSCPKCNHKLDAAAAVPDAAQYPRPGDLTICINCAAILFFDAELSPRLPNVSEWHDVICNPELLFRVRELQVQVRVFIERRKLHEKRSKNAARN